MHSAIRSTLSDHPHHYLAEMKGMADAIAWAAGQDVSSFARFFESIAAAPLIPVGSGGSFTAAAFLAHLHQHATGGMASPATPLMFLQQDHVVGSRVCFLSASGGNKDILAALLCAIQRDVPQPAGLVMRGGSKLAHAAAPFGGAVFAYEPPWRKDGFLATRTLMASCALLARAYGAEGNLDALVSAPNQPFGRQDELEPLRNRLDLLVLGGHWSWPAAVDFESKCSEAALARVLLSDLRSFGHGRHVWLSKRPESTAVIAFATPSEKLLATRTLALVPRDVPTLLLESDHDQALGALDLLRQSMNLVGAMGAFGDWDPGKPGVPEFGRKLYHLGPVGLSRRTRKAATKTTWLTRKRRAMGVSLRHDVPLESLLEAFLTRLASAEFDAIVMDYDGTLCEPHERFEPLRAEIRDEIGRLAQSGIPIGVATGRGKSVAAELYAALPTAMHSRIWVGYYNCSLIQRLQDPPPSRNETPCAQLSSAIEPLRAAGFRELEIRPRQITIEASSADLERLVITVSRLLAGLDGICVRRSRHSLDITSAKTSKLAILNAMDVAADRVLTIGDSGGPFGNDEDLLSVPCSLSVFDPTVSPDRGWHLGQPGEHFSAATLRYLRALSTNQQNVAVFDINKLT